MAVELDNHELDHLKRMLINGKYDGGDLMQARLAIEELIELREWRDTVFQAHPNIDLDLNL